MPEVNHTTPLPVLKYELVSCGEVITGTKEQLQALGIGAGRTFPGEPGGAKRQITVRDPRGLPVRINPERWGRGYTARISFPGLEYTKDRPIDFAPGVQKSGGRGTPTYKGTGAALVAAGLVLAHQLPGPTGVRKQRVRIRPDGSIVLGGRSMTRCADTGTRGAVSAAAISASLGSGADASSQPRARANSRKRAAFARPISFERAISRSESP